MSTGIDIHTPANPARIARHAPTVARWLLGLILFVPGVIFLLGMMPTATTPMPAGAAAFGAALFATGYMFPLIKGTEVLVGALLISGRLVPLALVILAPVLVNIVAFHAFLAPSGIVPGLVVLALELFLAWSYREAFRPLLALRK